MAHGTDKTARHSATMISAFFVMSVLNYVFSVMLSWFFDAEEYGVLGVAQSLLLFMALVVSAGFTWTAAHELAGGELTDTTRRRFRAAWSANTLLGALLALALWGAYASGLLPLGPAYRTIVPLVGLTTVILAARSVINGAVRGLCRFEPVALNTAGEVAIKAAVGLALVSIGFGADGALIGFVIGATAALLHSLWTAREAQLWRGGGWFDWGIVVTTCPLFVGMLGPALILNLDVLGLKLFSPAGAGDELAGFYQAAVILARTPVFIAQSLTMVLFSYAASSKADVDSVALRAWGRLLLPAALALAAAPEAAVRLCFPERYMPAAPALQLAALGGLVLALVTLLNGTSQASGSRRGPALASALAVTVQIGAMAWLVPQQGMRGAALALILAGLVALGGVLPKLSAGLRAGLSPHGVAQTALPLLCLLLPLVLLDDTTRATAGLKLALAAAGYLLGLTLVHWPAEAEPQRRPLKRIVQLLLGGS